MRETNTTVGGAWSFTDAKASAWLYERVSLPYLVERHQGLRENKRKHRSIRLILGTNESPDGC